MICLRYRKKENHLKEGDLIICVNKRMNKENKENKNMEQNINIPRLKTIKPIKTFVIDNDKNN